MDGPQDRVCQPNGKGQDERLHVEVRSIQEVYATGGNWGRFDYIDLQYKIVVYGV